MNENIDNKDNIREDYNINADENLSGTEHLTEPMESESQVEKLEQELAESKDKYIRLAAEFDNFRKRTAKEKLELFQTAGKDVITDLLDVLDDSDRALQQIEHSKDIKAVKHGVVLVFNKLKNILQSKGLKPMEAVGKEFDADLHDAITEIPAPSEDMKGKVVDEVTKGYYLNDKIIRHAKVVVGK
jgi:molecular chaperone GrpE